MQVDDQELNHTRLPPLLLLTGERGRNSSKVGVTTVDELRRKFLLLLTSPFC